MIIFIVSAIPMFVCAFWSLTILLGFKNNNKSKNFLGIIYAIATPLHFTCIAYHNQMTSISLFWENIYIFCSITIYPLFFLYIKLITKKKTYSFRNYWILIPAILMSLFSFILYANMNFNDRLLYADILFQKKAVDESLLTPVLQLQLIKHKIFTVIYVFQFIPIIYYGRKYILKYNRKIKNYYSDIKEKTIQLSNKWLLTFIIFSIISIIDFFLEKYFFIHSTLLLLIHITIFSVLLYMIAYLARGRVFTYEVFLDEITTDELVLASYHPRKGARTTAEILKGQLINDIITLFEDDNIYKKQDLRISELAVLLNSNRTYISNIINDELKTNFTDFVNEYRFNYSKEILSNKSNELMSISQVADMAGFSSDSSFYRVFKKKEGISPKDYKILALSIVDKT